MEQSSHRRRLLVLSPYYAAHGGGVEIVAGELATRLAASGYEVTWLASDTDAAPVAAGVHCVPMRSTNAIERRTGVPFPLWTPRALRRVWHALKECDLVLMHESLYLSNLFTAAAAKWLRKPLLVVQHVGEVPYRSRVLCAIVRLGNATVARFIHGCASRVVFVSGLVLAYFHSEKSAQVDKQKLIPNGMDPVRFHPVNFTDRRSLRARLGLPAAGPILLFVGRFVEKKGLHLLERLARERPAWNWIFIGSGPSSPEAWRMPHVRVVGRIAQQQLPDWYRAADMLVLPSTGEGFPLVVQEAMACGLPVAISLETAGALDGVRQMVFAESVDLDELLTVRRWLQLLDEALAGDLAHRRGEVARFAAEQWSWDGCVKQYADLMESLVQG
jgi:phosphatidyl-myo-inositol dimannoside synthase